MTVTTALVVGLVLLFPGSARAGQEVDVVKVIEWTSRVGLVWFPHFFHIEELEIGCADCHHETNAARLDMPHVEYLEDFWIDCASCHRAGEAAAPQACSNCHHDSPVSLADETLSSKVVIHRSCWACHDVGIGVEASRSCGTCHRKPPN